MPISNKKKRTAIYSVIIILVLIFGIIFPLYHLYGLWDISRHSLSFSIIR